MTGGKIDAGSRPTEIHAPAHRRYADGMATATHNSAPREPRRFPIRLPRPLEIGHLQRLRKLQFLSLVGTRVTDAGLFELQALAELKALNVARTSVSEAGIAELKRALPRLEVNKQEILMTP